MTAAREMEGTTWSSSAAATRPARPPCTSPGSPLGHDRGPARGLAETMSQYLIDEIALNDRIDGPPARGRRRWRRRSTRVAEPRGHRHRRGQPPRRRRAVPAARCRAPLRLAPDGSPATPAASCSPAATSPGPLGRRPAAGQPGHHRARVFAVGDVRAGSMKRVAAASGEGPRSSRSCTRAWHRHRRRGNGGLSWMPSRADQPPGRERSDRRGPGGVLEHLDDLGRSRNRSCCAMRGTERAALHSASTRPAPEVHQLGMVSATVT